MKPASNEAFYRAFETRDARFDGKFFVGVKTTGVYCRPICPAKPHRKNVEFFADALSAETAGYRPCLRCHPEFAPLSPAWNGTRSTVQRALRLIGEGSTPQSIERELSTALGISARHLRRLFEQELGQSPKQIADLQRLGFAKKLVVETRLPLTEIAFTSGFSSIRRFNDAFVKRFERTPTEVRKLRGPANAEGHGLQLLLPYRPPFDWASAIAFFESHQIRGTETVSSELYQRVFRTESGAVASFEVKPHATAHALVLTVFNASAASLHPLVQTVRRMFDLDSDPAVISEAFAQCGFTAAVGKKHPGLRLPRAYDPFEAVINTILGQLVSIEQAHRMIARLVEHFGEAVQDPRDQSARRLFPTPKILMNADLSVIGTTHARAQSLKELSKRVFEKKILLHSAQDPEQFRTQLQEIAGIGPWSAQYISIKALGDTDAFPGSDLILKRVLDRNPQIQLEQIRPWRAYAAIYYWKEFAALYSKRGKSDEQRTQKNQRPARPAHSDRRLNSSARRAVAK